MNPPEIDRAIDDIRTKLPSGRDIQRVILFGSAARNEATNDSDIDLFVQCAPRAKPRLRSVLAEVEKTHGVVITAIFYAAGGLDRIDRQFLEAVTRDGQSLRGGRLEPSVQELNLEPLRLVRYWAEDLSPRKRARFLRQVDGYESEKRTRGRRYTSARSGLLEKLGGWRVGRGTFVVPEPGWSSVDQLLREFSVRRSAISIWSQRP